MSITIERTSSPWPDEPFVYIDSFGQRYNPATHYDAYTDVLTTDQDMVDMCSIAGNVFRQQSQYASRWIDGAWGEYPDMGTGLRYIGSSADYHAMTFHHQDIPELVRRVSAWRAGFGRQVFDYETTTWRPAEADEAKAGRAYFGGLALATVLG